MTEVGKEQELSLYLEEWLRNNFSEWNDFYQDVCRNKKNGIYLLKGGTTLMDLLDSIMGTLEDKFCLPNEDSHLIPTRFASVIHLVSSLKSFKDFVTGYKPIIEKNIADDGINNYIVSGIYNMVYQIEQIADRCEKIYGNGVLPRPYQILRANLLDGDIDGFVERVNAILKEVPYLSRKKKFDEGHFQTMLQLLLIVLGFEPIAEHTLSDARIDMVIKLNRLTYIFEFKYTDSPESQAEKALQQIKNKGYAEPYKLTSQFVIGVGISFSGNTKCINGVVNETLFESK